MVNILNHFKPLFDDDFCRKVEEQWLRLKLFVCKRIPLSERHFHILWPRIITQDSRFSSVMKVISIVMLLPMNTAICERGFSMLNQIKSDGRAVMLRSTLNSLMFISINGPSLEAFNPQPAMSYWASTVHRRPNYRKPKAAKIDDDSDTCMYSDCALSEVSDQSDVTLFTSDSELDLKDDLTNE